MYFLVGLLLYCIVYRYLYSASHSINQTEALFGAFQLQENGKTSDERVERGDHCGISTLHDWVWFKNII